MIEPTEPGSRAVWPHAAFVVAVLGCSSAKPTHPHTAPAHSGSGVRPPGTVGCHGAPVGDGSVDESFGERLRHQPDRANVTQEELAERAGLTAMAFTALQGGER